jgi:hypothetical protein
MTRNEVLNSIALKKRFCKDCNIPINIFDEPYFSERLAILDSQFNCIDKFDVFCEELECFNNEQCYFEYYNSIKDSVIRMIKENTSFSAFLEDKFDDVRLIKYSIDVGNNNLYIDENNGKTFISLDMKKANFSALKHYSSSIFKETETWEDYIGLFTNSEHIKNSKYIRQVILGACNPKKQTQYEYYLMALLYLHMKELLGDDIEVFSIGTDEIIISANNLICSDERIKEVIDSCPNNIGSLIRFEKFDLHKIGEYGWMKSIYNDIEDKQVVFKGLNRDVYHQIVKHFLNKPIVENDLVFYYNGTLAKFLQEVDNPWKE